MGSPLTILHLIDTGGPGGAETVLLNVVGGLDARRWRSIAVAPEVNWLYQALLERRAETVLQSNLDGPAYLKRVRELVRRHRVSLIHAHLLGSGVYGTLAGLPRVVPVVCTFHGTGDITGRERFLGLKLRILARPWNRFVFVTDSLRRELLSRHALPPANARVVHNGIDPTFPKPTGEERAELGIPPDVPLVGAIGNVRPAKDYPTLLRAAALLRERGSRAHWLVLGHASDAAMADLRALRTALGLDGYVTFTGFRSDARRFLSILDVFVTSSSSEGFSLSTVEALWVGRPVVATRSGGPQEIVRDGETGRLVPIRSPQALADGVEALLRDRPRALRLGESGQRDVRERFSLSRMVEGYEAVYGEVLGGRRSRSQPPASLAAG